MFSIVRNEFYRMKGRAAPLADVVSLDEIAAPRDEGMAAVEMRDALMSLPASYAEPLALQVLGGFSCAEIAGMLGTTEGATMTRLTRARQALRRLVAPEGAGQRKEGRS
jgi:RNA polymerase sigma-70 factor (ECF subfamily)